MRIIFIQLKYANYFFGAEKLTYLYSNGLKELGHDVYLISLVHPYQKLLNRGEKFMIETVPTPIPYFKIIPQLNVINHFLAKRKLSDLFKNDETVILTDVIYSSFILKNENYAKKTVVPLFWHGPHSWVPFFLKGNTLRTFSLILNRAKAVTVISNAAMNGILNRFNIDRKKVFLVPETVDTERYNPKKRSQEFRKTLLTNKEVVVMTMPHSRYVSGSLLRIIEILKKKTRTPFKVLIAGGVKKRNLPDSISLTGYIPERILPMVYANSDIFLNIGFNRGMTVLEAMASGLPIVSLDPLVSVDHVSHGVNGFIVKKRGENEIPKGCESEAAEFLRILIEDSNLMKKMSSNSYKIAKENFDYRVISKKLQEVFVYVLKS
jgi:glycosyltransferase involved in cell wall biosynthesis